MKQSTIKKIVLPLLLMILAILAIRSNVSFHRSHFPVYRGMLIGLFIIFLNGFLIRRYLYATCAAIITSAVGTALKIYYSAPPHFKKADSLARFNEKYIPYINILQKYFVLIIVAAIIFSALGVALSRWFHRIQSAKNHNKKVSNRTSSRKTKTVVYMAVFVAISVTINTLRVGSVSFGGFPIIFSGFALGALPGFIVGAVADVVAFIVRPSSGGFNPAFTLTSALTGAIPVLVTTLLRDRRPSYKTWKVFIGILIGQGITTILMVPMFRVIFYGNGTFFYFVGKSALQQVFTIPAYTIVFMSLYEAITRAGIYFDHSQ